MVRSVLLHSSCPLSSSLLTTSLAPGGPPDSVSPWTRKIETFGKPGSSGVGALSTMVVLGKLQGELLSSCQLAWLILSLMRVPSS